MTLVCSFVLSRLDYYNCILNIDSGNSRSLQKIRNNAGWTVFDHQNMSMFLRFFICSTGFQSVNESTTNSALAVAHLLLGLVLNTLLTSSRLIYVPSRQLRPSSDACLFKQAIWPTLFCISNSYSLEQTPAQRQACFFHQLQTNDQLLSIPSLKHPAVKSPVLTLHSKRPFIQSTRRFQPQFN